jgi:hypothetical protein
VGASGNAALGPSRVSSTLAAILGLVAFWAGLGVAARLYPSEYDWRYMTISSLLYQDRNPQGYGWGRAGLVVCAICGLYWVLRGQRASRLTTGILAAGYGCMALCALVPSPFLGLAKPHETLALTAFIAVCVGVTRLSFAALVGSKQAAGRACRRLFAVGLSSPPLLPVVLAAGAQMYGEHAHLPWVSLAWRAQGVPVYWSFSFWEWVACGVYTGFLLWLVLRATGDAASRQRYRHPPMHP